MSGAILVAISGAHRAMIEPTRRRFARASRDVERAQAESLHAHLVRDAATAYGRAHGFAEIARAGDPWSAFRTRVPIVRWAELAPWIARAATGERDVLSASPIRFFERTSGSSGVDKLVPYTDAMLAEVRASTGAWLANLWDEMPGLRGGRAYWSLSPVTRQRETTAGGIAIGVEDDAEYFGPLERWAIARTMAVPGSVARTRDVEAWREATALHLMEAGDLRLISVWSPTFLTLLGAWIEARLEALLAKLSPSRASAIRRGLDREGAFVLEAMWPQLALVSCWTEGASATFIPALRKMLARTPIQPKGLLATEGVVSIPQLGGRGGVAAASGHVIELLDLETERAHGLHEAREGARYAPVLTTGGGLHRYLLPDVIRCIGRLAQAPRFVFEGRLDRTSDLAGEKLSAPFVERAIARALREHGSASPAFVMLAPARPSAEAPRYRLWIEARGEVGGLDHALERALRDAHHYEQCRRLGQLEHAEVRAVRDGAAAYARVLVARGIRLGDVKPAQLDGGAEWETAFDAS